MKWFWQKFICLDWLDTIFVGLDLRVKSSFGEAFLRDLRVTVTPHLSTKLWADFWWINLTSGPRIQLKNHKLSWSPEIKKKQLGTRTRPTKWYPSSELTYLSRRNSQWLVCLALCGNEASKYCESKIYVLTPRMGPLSSSPKKNISQNVFQKKLEAACEKLFRFSISLFSGRKKNKKPKKIRAKKHQHDHFPQQNVPADVFWRQIFWMESRTLCLSWVKSKLILPIPRLADVCRRDSSSRKSCSMVFARKSKGFWRMLSVSGQKKLSQHLWVCAWLLLSNLRIVMLLWWSEHLWKSAFGRCVCCEDFRSIRLVFPWTSQSSEKKWDPKIPQNPTRKVDFVIKHNPHLFCQGGGGKRRGSFVVLPT